MDFKYNGEYDKQISKLLKDDFTESNFNYELFGYIYYIAYEMKDPTWSAFKDNTVVVTPDGELNIYWRVCYNYLKGINKFFDAILRKHKDNHAMICCVAEVFEEYRQDKNDIPYSKICANLPEEIGIKVFNIPDIEIKRVEDEKDYYQYRVTTSWKVGKKILSAEVYVKDIFKEYILCSVCKFQKLGFVVLGARHASCSNYIVDKNILELDSVNNNNNMVTAGFYTNQGRFIKSDDTKNMLKLLSNHNKVVRLDITDTMSENFIYIRRFR